MLVGALPVKQELEFRSKLYNMNTYFLQIWLLWMCLLVFILDARSFYMPVKAVQSESNETIGKTIIGKANILEPGFPRHYRQVEVLLDKAILQINREYIFDDTGMPSSITILKLSKFITVLNI